MRSKIASFLRELRGCSSGNTMMLLGLSLPMVIGGAGFGVDIAQWYMWKRELQYAVDQGAIAGAWARTVTATQDTYVTRANQEFASNLSANKNYTSTPNVSLANYDGGTNNSVIVNATVTHSLPFSSMLYDLSPAIYASAQAKFTAGTTYTVCMLATEPTQGAAFKFGGSVTGTSACGAGTLSNSVNPQAAMKEVGVTDVNLGKLISAGDVDAGFANNGVILANQSGLSDPFASIAAPSSSGSTAQTYVCPAPVAPSTTYTADGTRTTYYTYKYYKGSNSNNWTLQTSYSGTGYNADSNTGAVSFDDMSVPAGTTVGTKATTTPVAGAPVELTGSGSNTYWRVRYTATQDNITQVDEHYDPGNDGIARPVAGIYTDIIVGCETRFSSGIYFVSGTIDFGQNMVVTGSNVMFVMTSTSGSIHINSNSNVTMSGITASTLMAAPYNYSAEDASKLNRMLFFDKDSTSAFTLNGNSQLHLAGTFYMPKRPATFNGNSYTSGDCMAVVARTIDIQGNFNVTNLCTPTGGSAIEIGGTPLSVKLVA